MAILMVTSGLTMDGRGVGGQREATPGRIPYASNPATARRAPPRPRPTGRNPNKPMREPRFKLFVSSNKLLTFAGAFESLNCVFA